ncbi:hypothetical protein KIN20_034470 [Parelaphostrongylus tenuis]|uniref:F-box domain-containing protein n=1 Tax=Parelaphostrongylus tenuis TaxID=148309 RepID=A0AAD5WJ80_PARTN|nr:hypothetical protein KIN20_034470 [Parelaphostrongylus tenuis]
MMMMIALCQPLMSSLTKQLNMNRTRSVLQFAKKKLLDCQNKLKRTGNKVPTTSSVLLDEPVLEEVLKKLDIKDRVMLRGVSPHIHDLVDRLPLILPFVFIRSDSRGNIELHCDQMDVLIGEENRLRISSLILLSRRSLSHLRFRHCRVHSQQQTVQLWTAVAQCQSLVALQYEPCRLDRWSRPHLVDALASKPLKSLILTGIDGLQPKDLFRMTNGARLEELAVVGELITPSVFDHKEASTMLGTIHSLLIQVNSTFSIHDVSERAAILRTMSSLPATGVLEVIHISRGTVTDTTKVISYWIQLARDSSREVKLKLEECSQERADAAVGRLLRKVRGVGRSEWTKGGVAMQMGGGRLTVLDKKAWFGDDQ